MKSKREDVDPWVFFDTASESQTMQKVYRPEGGDILRESSFPSSSSWPFSIPGSYSVTLVCRGPTPPYPVLVVSAGLCKCIAVGILVTSLPVKSPMERGWLRGRRCHSR